MRHVRGWVHHPPYGRPASGMVWSSRDGGTAENPRASERVATRRQSFDRPNTISIRSRRLSLYPFVFQRLPEPIGIIGPGRPKARQQAAQKRGRSRMIGELTCCHQDPDRTAMGIGYSMRFGVQAAFGSAGQTAPLVASPRFFACRLVAVRCAFG